MQMSSGIIYGYGLENGRDVCGILWHLCLDEKTDNAINNVCKKVFLIRPAYARRNVYFAEALSNCR
jgi:hypothetical protein